MSPSPTSLFERARRLGADLVDWVAPSRWYVGVWCAAVALGAATCFVPLFQLFGYESAGLFALFLGPTAAFLTLDALHTEDRPPPAGAVDAGTEWSNFASLAVRHVLLAIPPALLLLANGLRVRNCDPSTGAVFWGLMVLPSILVGQTTGWTAAVFIGRRWLQKTVVGLFVVATAATFGLHLLLEPPITAHQVFLGYFSGSIYDEALAVPSSLVAYRGINLAVVGAVLAGLEVRRRVHRSEPTGWATVVAVGFVTLATVGWSYRTSFGIGIDRAHIVDELGGRIETEHFVIHHPERESYFDQQDRIAEDHEFRYREMRRFFETDPAADEKLHSFIFADRDQKQELLGARNTLVAKIWLDEMYVLWPNYGHHWLAHELAHLFTAPFGAAPMSLSMQNGVGVNMGLVEGAATAADWPGGELTPHQASAALQRLEMAPEIASIVGAGGFWTQSSRRAYTVVGSFIRYLVDEYGVEDFKRAYPRGDFRGAYGESVDELVDEWRARLDDIELSERTMEVARFVYRRPSIFGKVCPRTTAELRRRADVAAARGDVGAMRELYGQLLDYVPGHVGYRMQYARRLVEVRDLERASELVDDLKSEVETPVQKARRRHLMGDIAWHRDEYDAAAIRYRECLDLGLPVDRDRLVRAKWLANDRERSAVRGLAYAYFLGDEPGGIRMFFPLRWTQQRPDDPLANYLVGRRLWQHRQWERALPYLEKAAKRIPRGTLRGEAERMYGRSAYFAGRLEEARETFRGLRDHERPRYRLEAEEWLDRISWK